ncbi:hypothetical protein CDAR_435251 [Caerostris darwini]|uniref:Uncharacterized protein n=1 Tax=Caerostris darwini TaxID=1538125 RepID=A0AAV4SH93_9ARAC|nr:hypothetical protein CDAR_435251 [Caerostris darwini]
MHESFSVTIQDFILRAIVDEKYSAEQRVLSVPQASCHYDPSCSFAIEIHPPKISSDVTTLIPRYASGVLSLLTPHTCRISRSDAAMLTEIGLLIIQLEYRLWRNSDT